MKKLTLLWIVAIAIGGTLPAGAQTGASDGDWHHYAGDQASTKYAPLDQINAENFDQLEILWRWETADFPLRDKVRYRPHHFRTTPLEVNGTIYLPTGLSQIAAVDAGSGETKWVYDPKSYEKGVITHGMFHHRGLEYWTDGTAERVLIATGGRQLISIDVTTGEPDPNFGENGMVDLSKDLGKDVNTRNIAHNSPVIVVRDTIVVGSIIMDFPTINANPPGHVRGYDVRTGEQKWIFHSIPQEGEFGVETWENESWKIAGNTNVWSMMSADEELGYVYLPFGTATNDYYGGHRLGDNLFSECLVALNAETGERVWHFQGVHHGIWDYDFPAAPNLVDITIDGEVVKAVAQVSKQGFTYVFNRVTGEPIWPIEERPVEPSTVPGERLSPTQPFPTKPPAFDRQGVTENDLIDFTPELNAEAKEILKKYKTGPLFTPFIVAGEGGLLGTATLPSAVGGANWPGASVDPETGILYVMSTTRPIGMSVIKPDAARSNFNYVVSFVDIKGPQGLPLTKPPYRRITAIDLNKGEFAWQIPYGEGPTNHPAIKDLNLGPLGTMYQENVIAEGGLLLTKTLLIGFLPIVDELGVRDADGSMLLAYDKATGELLKSVEVHPTLHGSPMTYLHEGRQYILIAAGGGKGQPVGELLAFGLPEAN